jgi:multidrug resistance efflux pump
VGLLRDRTARALRFARERPVAAAAACVSVLLVAGLLLLGIFGRWDSPQGRPAGDGIGGDYVMTRYGPGIRLRRGRFLWSFQRRGRLEPLEKKVIASRERGTVKSIWEDGKAVRKGEVIFELDGGEIEDEIADLEAELRIRKAVLVQSERTHAKAVKEAERSVKKAELELEWQKLGEKLLLSGPTATEAAQAEGDLTTRELVAKNREEELRILEELLARGFATGPEVGRKKLQLIEAKLGREKASVFRKRLFAGPDEPERKEARLKVEIAEHSLESARKKLESVRAMAAAALVRQEKLVAAEERQLRRERSRLARHKVLAPTDGYVLHYPTRWGGTWRPGLRLWYGTRIMSMPIGKQLKVKAKVAPSEIDHVTEGMACRVTVAARPGEAHPGEVTAVGSQGKDEFDDLDGYTKKKVGESGRRAFAVEVKILGETPELRPGAHAKVEFIVKEIEDALIVPWGALRRSGEGASLTVIESGKPVARAVEIAASNRHAAVIASGCEEGEIVLLAGGNVGNRR